MIDRNILNATLVTRFAPQDIAKFQRACRPRVLMVIDGGLSYTSEHGFGLARFIEAITLAPGVGTKPLLTLAHRNANPTDTLTIGPDTYTVINGFNFATAATAVTLANFDQIWMFGANAGNFGLGNQEVAVISEFMNGGGGVFATGDHASMGREMSGSLPRIRHMREWRDAASGGIPMGLEADANVAVNRIDSIVNPGVNGHYDFSDQSDATPQRIYPNYKVIDTDGAAGNAWQATVHPLLRMPGAPDVRNSTAVNPNQQFNQDIDVFPDHAHESVCYDVHNATTLNGTYNLSGQNFPEFQPMASTPAQRQGADIVAYGVSGGRTVYNGGWKPPVRPRMYGISSAYDGRLAQPYAGKTQRPGRILCDSTWHHYLNINLDGTESGGSGLGSWAGGQFTPSTELEKIYTYYRNAVSWLQPANRVWCSLWWDLAALRYHPQLTEDLQEVDRLVNWRDLVGLGQMAASVAGRMQGRATLGDQLQGLLLQDPRTLALADVLSHPAAASSTLQADELLHGALGALMTETARILPATPARQDAAMLLSRGPEPHVKRLTERLVEAVNIGLKQHASRIERTQGLIKQALGKMQG